MNGCLIEQRLVELEMRDERFAADLGVSMSTVRNMKKGKPIHLDTAVKAAQILKLDISELLMPKPQKAGRGKTVTA